jgi:hypothetical protein
MIYTPYYCRAYPHDAEEWGFRKEHGRHGQAELFAMVSSVAL